MSYDVRSKKMFEFHGWIAINEDDSDDADVAELNRRRDELCDDIERRIKTLDSPNRAFHLHRQMNGKSHLVFSGSHNHRDERVVEFFKEVGASQPCSYGKLHIRDDDDTRRAGYQNSMMQWTMASGVVSESIDDLMTPCIPSIEAELQ